jgi:large subunit ribosomal protein L23
MTKRKLTRITTDLLGSIKYPLITEKSVQVYQNQVYTFITSKSLKKPEIKSLFEKVFEIKIKNIKTLILPTKKKRTGRIIGYKPVYKKVLLKLAEGSSIPNIFG